MSLPIESSSFRRRRRRRWREEFWPRSNQSASLQAGKTAFLDSLPCWSRIEKALLANWGGSAAAKRGRFVAPSRFTTPLMQERLRLAPKRNRSNLQRHGLGRVRTGPGRDGQSFRQSAFSRGMCREQNRLGYTCRSINQTWLRGCPCAAGKLAARATDGRFARSVNECSTRPGWSTSRPRENAVKFCRNFDGHAEKQRFCADCRCVGGPTQRGESLDCS